MKAVVPRVIPVIVASAFLVGCAGEIPPDEALQYVRQEGDEYAGLGPGSEAEDWDAAARRYYPPAYRDYFEAMDVIGTTESPGPQPLQLGPEAIKGRNAWVIWTGGNEAWWDWVARNGYGSIDLLKVIDHRGRETRFARTGLVNEPGTRPPTEEETAETYGIRYARPVTSDYKTEYPDDDVDMHVEYRDDRGPDWEPPASRVYGYPTGVVGLRLFPNPEFDASAQRRWDPDRFYNDPDYAARPDTIRPFRVGMSCGYCHIAPHPLKPPANPEFPRWENLSNNVGNQFMRIRSAFGNTLEPSNYLYHAFDSMLPGAVDTSGYPSDNNNNPNTINSFYGLRGRLERAQNISREWLTPDSFAYVRDYTDEIREVDEDAANPRHLPRVLFDGSDSVGVNVALSRVYLNIGTFHQQWIRTINPLLGFAPQNPFKLQDIADNSLYWHATRIRINPMAAFFLASTDPMRLKDVELPERDGQPQDDQQDALLREHLRGTGLPWYSAPPEEENATSTAEPETYGSNPPPIIGGPGDYAEGRRVYARGCIACHSSVQPGDLLALERQIDPEGESGAIPPLGPTPPDDWIGPRPQWDRLMDEALGARRQLRLTLEDRARLTRGDGELPEAYTEWARRAVEHPEFWEHQSRLWDADGQPVLDEADNQVRVLVHNYMAIDERLPVTIVGTNSGRATGTNSLYGNVWEDFSSRTYKDLGEVGAIGYFDPFSGARRSYTPPGGGPGYYRVPTLISIWATSPLFHNNALGTFNNDPSVEGRLAVFEDSIERLLWPAKRNDPSLQAYWPGEGAATTVYDAWYPGKHADEPVDRPEVPTEEDRLLAADRRELDNGWIWRTTEESWLQFQAPHVPRLVGGVVGLTPEMMRWFVAWIPGLALVLVGVALLLHRPLLLFRERLASWFPWLVWLIAPIGWLIAIGSLVAVALLMYLIWWQFWPAVELLDVGTGMNIPFLQTQAILIPLFLLGSVALFILLPLIPRLRVRNRLAGVAGIGCLVLAILAAWGIGRTLAGIGASVEIGPIPKGIPVNVVANIDPDAPTKARFEAVDAFVKYLAKNIEDAKADRSEEAKARRRREFEAEVAPALMAASKCPDFVTDRGHDYVFIQNLNDQEKRELIALLKTF